MVIQPRRRRKLRRTREVVVTVRSHYVEVGGELRVLGPAVYVLGAGDRVVVRDDADFWLEVVVEALR